MEVTRTLARYLVNARYADLPHPVRHEAARALFNWLGCAIGASRHETGERARTLPYARPGRVLPSAPGTDAWFRGAWSTRRGRSRGP